jgi:hypothetical protein
MTLLSKRYLHIDLFSAQVYLIDGAVLSWEKCILLPTRFRNTLKSMYFLLILRNITSHEMRWTSSMIIPAKKSLELGMFGGTALRNNRR